MGSPIGRREFLKSVLALSLVSLVDGKPCRSSGPSNLIDAQTAPNVLILLLDALSAKHVSTYGYHRETMPHLTRFAQRATVYHAHYAAGNCSTSGTGSLLTGTYPWSHRAFNLRAGVAAPYRPRNLFHLLAGDTHTTLAYTHSPLTQILLNQFRQDIDLLIDPMEFYTIKDTVSGQVFANDHTIAYRSEYSLSHFRTDHRAGSLIASLVNRYRGAQADQSLGQELADLYPRGVPRQENGFFFLEDAIDGIRDLLKGSRQPFVGYFHLLPPHWPYRPRSAFCGLFEDGWIPVAKEPHFFSQGYSDAQLNYMRLEYDQFIAHADAEFGRLYDALLEDGLLDNTYLVLTSDHGEMFERGIWKHVTPVLYEPVIHVPLLISKPGQDRREDVHLPTSCVDLLPSLLHAMGRTIPDWCEGTILPTFGDHGSAPDRSIYVVEAKENRRNAALTRATLALIRDRYKLIHYLGYEGYENEYELYDLANDPEEMHNLVRSNKALAEELQVALQEKLDQVNQPYLKQ